MDRSRLRPPSYPIALDVRGWPVVVVGGGAVAQRKIEQLGASGARVTVVAPTVAQALRAAAERGDITLLERPFEDGDLAGARLAFAATNDDALNARISELARELGIPVNDAGDAARGDFSVPMVYRSGPLAFTVETGGLSPSFAKRLREELRARFGERYGRAAETLGVMRTYAQTVVATHQRAAVMSRLAGREIEELAAMNPVQAHDAVEAAVAELNNASNGAPVTQLVCATRASALAMWQTRHTIAQLATAGIASTILQLSTKGDQVQDRSLAAIGTDSLFVKELELALREGRADYAVHSCKDLPSALPDDMQLAAIGLREDPRDAFCSEKYPSFDALPQGALVGTSSPRRRAQLQALRGDLRYEVIRGNVDTRLRKLREGDYDAIFLAMAGLRRLGLSATHTVAMDPLQIVPAVGQGALAIECRRADDALAKKLDEILGDRATTLAVTAERAYLRTLRGGCQAPVGAHGTLHGDELQLAGVIASLDGSQVVRGDVRARCTTLAEAEELGATLARDLEVRGGAAILGPRDGGQPLEDPELPLAGKLFILPRTQDRPSRIAPALRGAGAEVLEAADSDEARAKVGERVPHVLLFPSSGSVSAITEYLGALRENGKRPIVAAMGAASSEAARAAGFPPDVVADEPTVAEFVHSVTQFVLKENLVR
jgi:hydroxymethylbilane synthase